MDIEQELLVTVKSLHGKFDEVLKWQATVEERCKSHRESTQGHRATLYGPDGRNGLVKQANSNTDFITTFRAWNIRVFGAAVAAAIIAAVSAILSLWKSG